MLDESVGYLVNQTGRKLTALLLQHFKPYDITPEQWTLLNRLGEQDGITQCDLAKRIDKDQTNVTRMLDQLERKGFVKRRMNEADRRSYLACITEEGKALVRKLAPIESEVLDLVTDGLSGEEVKLLKSILLRLTENAVRHTKN